jgi:diguanylate cyclase
MSESGDWRSKYYDVLARLEAASTRWKALETMLHRVAGRLCLGAQGRSPRLDAELERLTRALREQQDAAALGAILADLSSAITDLDRTHPSAAEVARTASVQAAGLSAAASSGVAEALLQIVERVTPSPETHAAVTELRTELAGPTQPGRLAEIAARVAHLVAEERARLEREKVEIERILSLVTARLDEIARYLASADQDSKTAEDSGTWLNLRVLGEVRELGGEVKSASDLAALQQQVQSRLEAIDGHLQEYRAREQVRIKTYRERAEQMQRRVQELELEARKLEQSLRDEQRLSMLDSLTGIANRAAYDVLIEQEWARWQRFRRPVSIVAWDLDSFKSVNDAFGHQAGDTVLHTVAQHLQRKLRTTDFVARYGGEEFVMVLVGSMAKESLGVAETLRQEIAHIEFKFTDVVLHITVSCGIADFRDGDVPAATFDRADRALYKAKQAGRNRCVIA